MSDSKPIVHVKVMNSYDYCHFEVSLGAELKHFSDNPLKIIDNTRKDAQRLVDKAIEQYKIAKEMERERERITRDRELTKDRALRIADKPKSEWTPYEKAIIKLNADNDYWEGRVNATKYDYEDDFEYCPPKSADLSELEFEHDIPF